MSAARCYSATAETAKTEGAAPEGEAKKEEATKEDPVKTELEAKKREVVDVTVRWPEQACSRRCLGVTWQQALWVGSTATDCEQDKWKRSIAEYRNLQAQTKREVQAAKDFALQRFAKDLIDSVDNLDRALSTVEPEKLGSNAELKNLHDGLKMTETILMQTLKKHGLERIDPSENSEKFDPNKHKATFQVPQPDKQDGTVFHTQSKGFSLNGRVLRVSYICGSGRSRANVIIGSKGWRRQELIDGTLLSLFGSATSTKCISI